MVALLKLVAVLPDLHNIYSLQFTKSRMNALPNLDCSLRKHAHPINRFFLALKIESFQRKNVGIFLIFAQNIYCGYEYPQSMF